MTTDTRNLTVTRSVTVRAGVAHAFTVFTERFGTWWPASHHIGTADLADAIIEPHAGGRWYERGVDGAECEWGQVLAYEPPTRLLLSWHLQGDWSYDPNPAKASEIEVRFIADGEHTRVELAHRHIERHTNPDAVLDGVGGPGGWLGILTGFAEQVAGPVSSAG